MKVRLINHSFPDDPSWILVKEDVPIGTVYEVIGYERQMIVCSLITGKQRKVETFLCQGNGSTGYIPTNCLEVVNEDSASSKGN